MHYYCTICSKEKNLGTNLLPAIERYSSPRLKHVYKKSQIDKCNFLILSGKYGFIQPYNLIPYYDHLLMEDEVDALAKILMLQNEFLQISELECFMENRNSTGWLAYFKVLEKFAEIQNVQIKFNTCPFE